MASVTQEPESPQMAPAQPSSLALFVLGTIAIAGILGVAAGHAPDRIRAFGLFSIGFGLLCGGLMSWVASAARIQTDWRKLVFIGLATFAGLVTYVCRTATLLPLPVPKAMHPVAALVAEQMRKQSESGETPSPSEVPMIQPIMMQPVTFTSRVQSYLHRRVNSAWPSPWPELLWLGEALLGVSASVWIAYCFREQDLS